ncbi:MAG: L,D-transpeptidase family protein [Bacteroidia bacterium]|nr:L,D-transpeptidase family protein [Bacteroidia bacterium]
MNLSFWSIFAVLLIGISAFLFFGRDLYKPLIQGSRKSETVNSVKEAIGKNAMARLKPHLTRANLEELPTKLLLLGFKKERKLEVYFKRGEKYQLLRSYPFTAFSGKMGPKLREGDKQIPEGIYKIEFLNPNSSYHLSMKVSYPNEFDKEMARKDGRTQLGGDIFIHGKKVTIGCIPIGDEAIEELFLLAENALNQGIKVIISPHDFRFEPVFPEIESVDWEEKLYENIRLELYSI